MKRVEIVIITLILIACACVYGAALRQHDTRSEQVNLSMEYWGD